MLPSQHRYSLRNNPQFFNNARRIRGGFFTIFYQDTNDAEAQFACIAAKKNFPTAVGRNKVKRQVRALLAPLLSAGQKKNIVITIYEPLKTNEQRTEFQDAIQQVFNL
jgi:ribonuclease P protein component